MADISSIFGDYFPDDIMPDGDISDVVYNRLNSNIHEKTLSKFLKHLVLESSEVDRAAIYIVLARYLMKNECQDLLKVLVSISDDFHWSIIQADESEIKPEFHYYNALNEDGGMYLYHTPPGDIKNIDRFLIREALNHFDHCEELVRHLARNYSAVRFVFNGYYLIANVLRKTIRN